MSAKRLVSGLLLVIACGSLGMIAESPTAPPREAQVADPSDQASPSDTQLLRSRLDRMLDGIDARRARVREAIAVLDNGGSVEEARLVFSDREDRWQQRRDRVGVGGDASARPENRRREASVGHAGPDGARRPRERGVPAERLSDEDVRELRKMIAQHLPDIDEGLVRLESQNPAAARVLVERLAPRLLEVAEIRNHDGELAAIRLEEIAAGAQVVEVFRRVRERGEMTDDLRGELRDAVERQFDARARAALHEIVRMEMRLDELRAEFESRRSGRDAEIERALDRIITRADRARSMGKSRDD